jgi:hypothetical protein
VDYSLEGIEMETKGNKTGNFDYKSKLVELLATRKGGRTAAHVLDGDAINFFALDNETVIFSQFHGRVRASESRKNPSGFGTIQAFSIKGQPLVLWAEGKEKARKALALNGQRLDSGKPEAIKDYLENVFEGRVITKNIDMLKNMSEQDRSKFVEELIKFL